MATVQTSETAMQIGLSIVSILWAVATFVSVYILWKEWQKRKNMDQKIVSKYLHCTSLSTLITIPICCAIALISGLPIICQYTLSLSIATRFLCYLPMGFFQLSRLYYCFSEQSSHSKKGYPICIFIILLIFSIILTIQLFIGPLIFYHSKYEPTMNYLCMTDYDIPSWPIFFSVAAVQLILCDWIILALYMYKVWQINNYHKAKQSQSGRSILQYTRIKKILSRIILLTICYEFAGLLTFILLTISEFMSDVIGAVIASFGIAFNLIVVCYVMRLMLEHNTEEYKFFIQILHKLKIFVICCCCKSVLVLDFEDQDKHASPTGVQNDEYKNVNKKIPTGLDDTMIDTRDNHLSVEHREVTNLSTVTKTENDIIVKQDPAQLEIESLENKKSITIYQQTSQ
eukprot:299945_1